MVCNLKGRVVVYLVSYRVDDIDMLGGRMVLAALEVEVLVAVPEVDPRHPAFQSV